MIPDKKQQPDTSFNVAELEKETLPAIQNPTFGSECGSAKDERLPYLMLAQGSLDYIREGKANQGDIVDSETKTPVVKSGQELELIPFYLVKYWRIDKTVNGKTMKDRVFPYIEGTEHDDWKVSKEVFHEKDGEKVRYLNYMLYCLDPKNLAGIPYVVTFKKGSIFTGKSVSGYFKKCGRSGKSPANWVLKLQSKSTVNPMNNTVFFKFEAPQGRETTKEEMTKAYEWYQIISKSASHAAQDNDEAAE